MPTLAVISTSIHLPHVMKTGELGKEARFGLMDTGCGMVVDINGNQGIGKHNDRDTDGHPIDGNAMDAAGHTMVALGNEVTRFNR